MPPLGPNAFRDGRGRTVEVRDLSVLDRGRLRRAAGDETPMYYNLCLRLARVAAIEGEAVPLPKQAAGFEAIMERLDEDGLDALTAFLTPPDAAPEDKTSQQRQEEAKAAEARERDLIRDLVEQPGFVSSVGLVTSGVPPDVVFGRHETFDGFDHIERAAWTIAAGIAQGHEWSWDGWRWRRPDPE